MDRNGNHRSPLPPPSPLPTTPSPLLPIAPASPRCSIRDINSVAVLREGQFGQVDMDWVLGIGGFDLERVEADVNPTLLEDSEKPAHGEEGHVCGSECGHDHDHEHGHGHSHSHGHLHSHGENPAHGEAGHVCGSDCGHEHHLHDDLVSSGEWQRRRAGLWV